MANNITSASDAVYGHFMEKGQGGSRPNVAAQREVIIRRMYERVLMELNANKFKWNNLPPSVDVRYMELSLQRQALAVFYLDKRFNQFMALPATPSGQLNLMDEPIAYTIQGRGPHRSIMLKADKCVPIWANYLRVPDLDIIQIYAQRLASIDRSIEIGTNNLRRSRVLVGSKNQRLTLANVSRLIDEGNATIGVGTNFDIESIREFDLGADPKSVEALQLTRTRVWNECMGLLGINNANQDKKERLVADEVAANDEQVTAMKHVNLNARRRAADEINEMFDLDVTVEYATTTPDELSNLKDDIDNPNADTAIDLVSKAPSLMESVGLPGLVAQVEAVSADAIPPLIETEEEEGNDA